MVNEAIFSGLISALSRGESLKNAMFTFYNAGYGRKEIEEAARELHRQAGGGIPFPVLKNRLGVIRYPVRDARISSLLVDTDFFISRFNLC